MKIILLLLFTTCFGGCAAPYIVMEITDNIRTAKQKDKENNAIDTLKNNCEASSLHCESQEVRNEK